MRYTSQSMHGSTATKSSLIGRRLTIRHISTGPVVLVLLFFLFQQCAFAAPGDTLFSDDFESGFGQWTAAGTGDASIGTETANSASSSMRLRWDTVTSTSIAINAAVPAVELSVWIQAGDDSFSEDPDIGGTEDLNVQYLNNVGTWVTIETLLAGNPGQVYPRTYVLPADALHAALQIRFGMPGGSGGPPDNGGIGWDYWHIDDTVVTEISVPAPFAVGDCDDFESGFSNWSAVGTGDSNISGYTFNSPGASMHLRWNTVTTTSVAIDYSAASAAVITMWIQRGSDTFSENPEAGEDLTIQYRNNVGSWITLETFVGNGTQGEVFTRNYNLPVDALHAGFQLRFNLAAGSGSDYDYWHIDDVCFYDAVGAYYKMDEFAWAGAGTAIDSSGNNNHGNPLGNVAKAFATPAIPGNPGTCGYGVFPLNTATGTYDAVNSTLTPTATGGVTFWYYNNTNWNGGGDRMLLDASANLGNGGADKYFFLVKRNNGRLRFRLEDSADRDTQAQTAVLNFPAGSWTHIAVSWDLGNDVSNVYVNGALSATSTTNVNGNPGAWNTLYIGDNRTTGVSNNGYTGNSADGFIDEVRIYGIPLTPGMVAADMADTHSCTNHFVIGHDGAGINCQAEPVLISAHLVDHTLDTLYTGLLYLSASTGRGDWTVISGTNPINNGTANDGSATYLVDALDNGEVLLGYKNTTVETVNLNVSDLVYSETTGSATLAEDPNLVLSQSGFQFLANSLASNINNQIGGKPSNIAPGAQTLELQAIRTSDSTGQCEAALQGNVDVEMAFECRDPVTCTANLVNINGGTATNIAGNAAGPIGAWTNVSLDFGNATDTTATFTMNYPDVGQLQLHARYNIPLDDPPNTPSGTYMNGSSNVYVVRPFGFYVNVTGNPGASGPLPNGPATTFTQAGVDFTVTSTAVLWDAADDSNNDGIPDGHEAADVNEANNTNLANNAAALNYGQETITEDIVLGSLLDQPAGGNDPNLAGTTTVSSFVNGTGSTNTARFDEVGIIEITTNHADGNYLGVAGAIGKSGYVGRFVPNHFLLGAGMITNRVDSSCAPASNFTYLEETQRLEFSLTAENARTPAATTLNYTGAFAYLDLNTIANLNIGAIDSVAPTPLSARITEDSSTGNWLNGIANPVFARVSLNRDSAMTNNGPFTNLRWGIAPIDSDNVTMNILNLDVDDNTVNDRTTVASNSGRFGRVFIESTSGSELLPHTLPIHIEYYDGTQFIRNTNDSCSTYNSINLSFSNRVGLPANPGTSGSGTFINGSFDPANPIQLDSGGNSGSVDATLNAPGYLEFDWDGDSVFDDDPTGKATFGIFDINSKQIYTREVY